MCKQILFHLFLIYTICSIAFFIPQFFPNTSG